MKRFWQNAEKNEIVENSIGKRYFLYHWAVFGCVVIMWCYITSEWKNVHLPKDIRYTWTILLFPTSTCWFNFSQYVLIYDCFPMPKMSIKDSIFVYGYMECKLALNFHSYSLFASGFTIPLWKFSLLQLVNNRKQKNDK